MNKSQRNIKSFYHQANSLTQYLSDEDKYLARKSETKYRFNIIGAGNIGREHINVTMLEGRSAIHGIYDENPKVAKDTEKYFRDTFPNKELVVYDSLEEACSDSNVDGLIICTPNYTHINIVREAVKYKKHILLEKPMATNVNDAKEIMDIANNYEPVLQIGLQYRYKPVYVEAIHEALERKNIGDIKTITIMEHRIPFLDKIGQWNKFTKYSGGTLVEKCCHYFDLFNVFAQARPTKVYATGSASVNFNKFTYDDEKSDIIDNAFVNIEYENGVRANFNLCMFSPMFYEELVLCGDEGRIKTSETENFIPIKENKNYFELIRVDGSPSKIMYPDYSTEVANSGHSGSSYYEHIQFLDSIDGKSEQAVTVEEGFWSIIIGAVAEESLKTGEIILVDDFLKNHKINI